MRGEHAARAVFALALAALAGCTSTPATHEALPRLTVSEIIAGQATDVSQQFEITGRLYPAAPRSVFLVDATLELPAGEGVPFSGDCVQVATTASQSRSLRRYEGQVVTLVGSIARIPFSGDQIVMALILDGKQQIHPYCQYARNGGVVPIIDLESWKRP